MNALDGKTLLIIEDDEPIRETIQQVLEFEGYTVFTAENGQVGIDLLEKMPSPPNAVLLDLMMPGLNGWQVLSLIRNNQNKNLSRTPVIVISAAGEIAKTALTQGANSYLKKPIELDDLIETVKKNCL